MWQRKQTIFLVIVVICLVLSIFFPVWHVVQGNEHKMLYPLHYTIKTTTDTGEVRATNYFPYSVVAILLIAAATIAATEIGKFTNRLLQLKMALLNSILMTAAIGGMVYFATSLIKENQIGGEYGFGLYLPAIAVFANLIANRFIRADEKLIRDSNRIR